MTKLITTASIVFISLFSVFEADAASLNTLNRHIDHCYKDTLAKDVQPTESACLKVIKNKLTTRKNKAVAFHNLAVLQLKAGATTKAQHSFEDAVRYNAKQTSSLLALVQIYLESQPVLAQAYLERVLLLNPEHPLTGNLKRKIEGQQQIASKKVPLATQLTTD